MYPLNSSYATMGAIYGALIDAVFLLFLIKYFFERILTLPGDSNESLLVTIKENQSYYWAALWLVSLLSRAPLNKWLLKNSSSIFFIDYGKNLLFMLLLTGGVCTFKWIKEAIEKNNDQNKPNHLYYIYILLIFGPLTILVIQWFFNLIFSDIL